MYLFCTPRKMLFFYQNHSPDFFGLCTFLLYTAPTRLLRIYFILRIFLAYVPFCCTLRQLAYCVFTSFSGFFSYVPLLYTAKNALFLSEPFSGFFGLMYLFCTPRKMLFFYQNHSPDFRTPSTFDYKIKLSIFNELLRHLSSYVYILF